MERAGGRTGGHVSAVMRSASGICNGLEKRTVDADCGPAEGLTDDCLPFSEPSDIWDECYDCRMNRVDMCTPETAGELAVCAGCPRLELLDGGWND